MLCYAMLCYAMLCHAMPCHAMPCHAMPCHAMPCHAMPCHAMPYHTIPYYTILHYTIVCWRCLRCRVSKCRPYMNITKYIGYLWSFTVGMARMPLSILLVDSETDFAAFRYFYFHGNFRLHGNRSRWQQGCCDIWQHRTGDSQFCANHAPLLSVYSMGNLMGVNPLSSSSRSSSPSWHPPSVNESASKSSFSEYAVSR